MSENNSHRIRVSKGDLTIEVEGSQSYVDERFDELRDEFLKKETLAQTEVTTSDARSNKSTVSKLDELYNEANIEFKRDAALLIGWFLENNRNQPNFTKSEVEDWAIKAKIELGQNLARDLSSLVKRGHLLDVGERNNQTSYYLTRSGEEYVENELEAPINVS